MSDLFRRAAMGAALAVLTILAACVKPEPQEAPPPLPATAAPGNTPEMQRLVSEYADLYGMPASLVHRVIRRESMYNPGARNGPYWGLMQILPQTARQMGYQGSPTGLLNAETNLRYAGKYLRGAWMVSGGSEERAVMWYAKGYYYEAKRLGLLEETGLRN